MPISVPEQQMTYAEIADHLSLLIQTGGLKPGERLPSYAELAGLYGVSVSTVQRAVAILRDRRVAVGRQGRGVFVAERDV